MGGESSRAGFLSMAPTSVAASVPVSTPAPADARKIPPPPDDPEALLAWAEEHGVAERLDDVFLSAGRDDHAPYAGTFWPGRAGETLTYRRVLVDSSLEDRRRWRYFDVSSDARELLHRMARAMAQHRRTRTWIEANGRDPEAAPLAAFLSFLRAERQALVTERLGSGRPPGTYFRVGVELLSAPTPALRYAERALNVSDEDSGRSTATVTLALLAWAEAPPRWSMRRYHEHLDSSAVPLDARLAAVDAMIDFVRDPRRASAHEELADVLTLPAWRFALGDLDRRLAQLAPAVAGDAAAGASGAGVAAPITRVGFRLSRFLPGGCQIEPVLQKRQKNGTFSKGQRLEWYRATSRSELTDLDRAVFRAHDDRFAQPAVGVPPSALTYGILVALIDHPVVSLEGPKGDRRPDIRQGRLRLRFGAGRDGGLTPQLELLGHTLAPSEVAAAAPDGRHLILLREVEHHPPQVLLARLAPEAAAVIAALGLAPGPVEAHDALATRLESLQEAMDIEFPSQWTRTIASADGRPLARLELLGSGALQVRLAVRPVKHGPVFSPGEGPTLILEGQGSARHGARRDLTAERQAAHALAERLELASMAAETAAWSWRVNEGDPALHVVATLRELGDAAVVVEWSDDARLVSLGSVGRGDLRVQVADRRDWFGIEGGATVRTGGAKGSETVPLSQLFAAIRDGHRYVTVGGRGFVRIEETLRAALARAEGVVFEHRGALQVSAVGSDALVGLVEHQAQLDASASFLALRTRMKQSEAEEPRLSATLAATLRPYQREGVTWMGRLAHWGAGAVLADEMGLGKTVQTLALLSHRAAVGPALVVAPTSVVPNWLSEAARFTPELTVRDLRGPARGALASGALVPAPGEVWMTSYAIATLEAEGLARHTFATLVIDEAQAVKNATTERAKALRDLDAGWRLALTGTPVENRLSELWSIFRIVSPGLFGSWEQFRARYAVPIEKFGDDARRRGLAALLRPFVLRRTKEEVARDLPSRTEVVRTIRLSTEERGLYEELRRATIEELAQAKKDPDRDASDMRFVLLAALTRLRQLCCHPRLVYPDTTAGSAKAAHLLELMAELREGGHKVLVFSQFRSLLELLAPRLAQHGHRVLVLYGTTPANVRERRIAAFQAGEADAFLISLKAGGFGLNLTAADTVIHMDPWWNPAVEDQATARAHRIGQHKPVTAIRLVARDTIEEAVIELHAAKRALAASVLEGSEVAAALDNQQLAALIERGLDHPG